MRRIEDSFGNVFRSPSNRPDSGSPAVRRFKDVNLKADKYSFQECSTEQLTRAYEAVTARTVIETLEMDTFQRVSRDGDRKGDSILGPMEPLTGSGEKTKDMPDNLRKPRRDRNQQVVVLNLMLSVRVEGPDVDATVSSPVVEILELAIDSQQTRAEKDITELDNRLMQLSQAKPNDIQVMVAATVSAFLRDDVSTAEDRIKNLLDFRSVSEDVSQNDDATLWLARRYALKHESWRIAGSVLAERALAAVEKQTKPGLEEAILRELDALRS